MAVSPVPRKSSQFRLFAREAGIRDEASEVIFWGADSGKVTIRDNTGIVGAGKQEEPAGH